MDNFDFWSFGKYFFKKFLKYFFENTNHPPDGGWFASVSPFLVQNTVGVLRIGLRLPPFGPRKSPGFPIGFKVGAPGIEPGLSAPKADVLPVYYAPTLNPNPRMRTTTVLYPPTMFFTPRRCTTGLPRSQLCCTTGVYYAPMIFYAAKRHFWVYPVR